MEENNNENTREATQTKPKRNNFLVEMAKFLWAKKAYWIVPVILFLLLLIFLIMVGSSPVSPFIYTII